jgi:enoyl-CoA hydratase
MIRIEQVDRVGVLRIDRPAQRNALNREHITDLLHGLDTVLAAGSRCVLLTGEGSSFCSGGDLDVVHDEGFLAGLSILFRRLAEMPVPVIAAVNGPAIGAGASLAFACDLRIATGKARFAIPTARLGLGLDAWSIRRLVALGGTGAARAILIGVESVPSDRAHALGLVDRLGDLKDALTWAREIAGLAPLSLAYYKLAIEAESDSTIGDGTVEAALAACWDSTDAVEALQARSERRPPEFRGH